jgi:ElaB/YqjD/DUF883 family membrane-anchored ribosome-binding protein
LIQLRNFGAVWGIVMMRIIALTGVRAGMGRTSMAASKAKGAAKAAAGRVETAAADLDERLQDLGELAGRNFSEAVDLGEEAVAAVVDFVEREPWKAVAIAGVLGLLVGLAARR